MWGDGGYLDSDRINSDRLLRFFEDFHHLLNRGDTGNGFFREGKGKSHSPDHLAVDENRAPAHPRHYPRVLQWTARKLSQDGTLFRSNVLQNAQDFYVKFL